MQPRAEVKVSARFDENHQFPIDRKYDATRALFLPTRPENELGGSVASL